MGMCRHARSMKSCEYMRQQLMMELDSREFSGALPWKPSRLPCALRRAANCQSVMPLPNPRIVNFIAHIFFCCLFLIEPTCGHIQDGMENPVVRLI